MITGPILHCGIYKAKPLYNAKTRGLSESKDLRDQLARSGQAHQLTSRLEEEAIRQGKLIEQSSSTVCWAQQVMARATTPFNALIQLRSDQVPGILQEHW